MLPILDKQQQTEYELLSILDSDDRWWTSAELSKTMGISTRTVQNYIHYLSEDLEKWGKDDIFIKVYSSNGIHLYRKDNFNIHEIYNRFAKKSTVSQFFTTIFFEKTQSLVEFCLKNYCSASFLYRKLSPMRESLKAFNLELDVSSLKIVGNEINIRYFYYTFFREIYRGCEWPFKNIKYGRVSNLMERFCDYFNCGMSKNNSEQFAFWLAIIMTRVENGHILKDCSPFNCFTEGNSIYKGLSSIIDMLYDAQNSLEAEKQFAFSILYAFPFSEKIHIKLFEAAANKNGEPFYPLYAAQVFIKIFREYFNEIPIAENNIFLARLICLHCHTHIFIGSSDLQENYPFLKNLKNTYPVFYRKLLQVYNALLKTDAKKYFMDREYLLPRYALICSSSFNIASLEDIIYICLFTDYGPIYEEKMKKEIIGRYSDSFNIRFTSEADESKDMIITNISSIKNWDDIPLLNIREAFNSREWSMLYSMLEKIRNEKSKDR